MFFWSSLCFEVQRWKMTKCGEFLETLVTAISHLPSFQTSSILLPSSLDRRPHFLFYWEDRCYHRRGPALIPHHHVCQPSPLSLCCPLSLLVSGMDFVLPSKANTFHWNSYFLSGSIINFHFPLDHSHQRTMCYNGFQKGNPTVNPLVSLPFLYSHQNASKSQFFLCILPWIHTIQVLCISFLLLS